MKIVKIGLALAALAAAGIACAAAPALTPYVSEEGHFRVLLPGTPEPAYSNLELTMGLNLRKTSVFVESLDQRVAYIVTYADFPEELVLGQDPQDFLRSIQEEHVQGRSVSSESMSVHQGLPAHHYEFVDTQGMMHSVHLFLAGTRLYQLFIVGQGSILPYVEEIVSSLDFQ